MIMIIIMIIMTMIEMMIMMTKIILIIVVVIMINSLFQSGYFLTGFTTDWYLGNYSIFTS